MASASGSAKGFTCGKCWNWTIQILIWCCLVWMIFGFIFLLSSASAGVYVPFIVLYIIYWINMCCSETFAYLNHKKAGNTIYAYMGSLFYTPGFVDFHIQCYHYELRTYYHRDSNGREHMRT